ncbi:glutamine amidotransferase [Planctomycetota bacterium]|nr:glutamine amidotransferase [Planctomycetota bacterium]
MSSFGFSEPWLLLLAIPLAIAVFFGVRGSRSPLTPLRIWIGGIAISVLLLSTLATVSGFHVKSDSNFRTVWVLVDQSISTGENSQRQLPDVLARLKSTLTEGDMVGIITFHNEASIVMRPTPVAVLNAEFQLPDATPTDETWLAMAVNLARTSTPDGTSPVVLALTDGFDSALRYEEDLARDLRLSGLSVFPLPVDSTPRPEVALATCDVRVAGKGGAELAIDITAFATTAQTSKAIIRIGGKDVSDKLFDTTGKLDSDGNWKLAKGRNLLRLRLTPPQPAPAYVVEIALASEADTFPGNNAVKLNVRGQGDAKALLIHGARGPEPSLVRALAAANLPVTQGRASILPSEDSELSRFQVLILSDVAATEFSLHQLALIARWTRNGGGLAMIGGEDSYAPGGYFETAIEDVLPVTCDVTEKGRKRVPAMIVVLDRSGSMGAMVGKYSKMELANQGCVKALKLIPPGSFFGMLSVDTSPNWPVPIQKVDKKNRAEVISLARKNTPGGGGIYVDIAIREGLGALNSTESIGKHLVLFSDGSDTERQNGVIEMAAEAFKKQKITVSTICLGSGPDWPFLQNLAANAGGRAFLVNDASKLPAIFSREAAKAGGAYIRENAFRPYHGQPGLLTEGISFESESTPTLLGYVATTAKENAHVWLYADKEKERPLLATWNVELGRAMAWTSDARDRWSDNWLKWDRFNEVWQRWIKSLVPPQEFIRGVEPEWIMERNGPTLNLTFYDANGSPRELADPMAEITLPDGTRHQVKVQPVGAGVYRIPTQYAGSGLFGVSVRERPNGESERLVARESRLFIPLEELIERKSNTAFLQQIASATGGKVLSSAGELASQEVNLSDQRIVPLSTLIWIAVICLFLAIGARRFPVLRRGEENERLKKESERVSEARVAFERVQAKLAKRREPTPAARPAPTDHSAVARVATPKASTPREPSQDVEEESLLSAMRKVRKELEERKK